MALSTASRLAGRAANPRGKSRARTLSPFVAGETRETSATRSRSHSTPTERTAAGCPFARTRQPAGAAGITNGTPSFGTVGSVSGMPEPDGGTFAEEVRHDADAFLSGGMTAQDLRAGSGLAPDQRRSGGMSRSGAPGWSSGSDSRTGTMNSTRHSSVGAPARIAVESRASFGEGACTCGSRRAELPSERP